MKPPAIKLHKTVWLVLVILLPIIMISSSLNRPSFPQIDIPKSLPSDHEPNLLLGQFENEFLNASLIQNGAFYTLNITLSGPLKSASTVIYDPQNRVVGQLHGSNTVYDFKVFAKASTFEVRDDLKGSVITKIEFE